MTQTINSTQNVASSGKSLLLILLLGILGLVGYDAYNTIKHTRPLQRSHIHLKDQATSQGNLLWPPRLHRSYPDLRLQNTKGQTISLSQFRGKVIVIEPVGMNCPGCQALSGAHECGRFQRIRPQPNLVSLKKLFPRCARGMRMNDPRIVFIQLLLFNMKMKAPGLAEARKWSKHFGFDKHANTHVLLGDARLLSRRHYAASYRLIPGVQIIDKDFILRADSTGHSPRHSLCRGALRLLPGLLRKATKKSRMSVARAYRMIPHRRTLFHRMQSTMPSSEKNYLTRAFALIEEGTRQRVQTLQWFRSKGKKGMDYYHYHYRVEAILNQWKKLQIPPKLQRYHRHMRDALQAQRKFFYMWQRQSQQGKRMPTTALKQHPLIRHSSRELRSAYSQLLRAYPRESNHNKRAFFDYHCALDFI